MPIYKCDNCNYSTTIKTHYNKHLKTKKHINKLKEIDNKIIEKLSNPHKSAQTTHNPSQMTHNPSQMTHNPSQIMKYSDDFIFMCEYCNKSFNRKDNLKRHIKTYCENKKENDNKNKELKIIIEHQKIELEKQKEFYKEEIEKLHQKIEILILQKNTPTIINIDKQINLNNYGSEDLSHITENFKNQMLKIPFVAIPKMIEEVHFSEKKPENNNIKLTNKKDNYVKVYQGDKWIFKDRKSTIKQLMDDKYTIIDNHYEEYKEEPKPKHVDSQYKKFKEMYNDGDRDLHNEIRVDCELLLLNNMEK